MDVVQQEEEYQEPDVLWPDLEKPITVVRDLVLVRRDGKRKATAVSLCGIKLEVLVNMCLYLVVEDSDSLRCGQVLSRNLDLTRKHGGTRKDITSHCFVLYDGLNDARRGIGRIEGNYIRSEIPNISGWRKQLEWMMRQAWVLHQDDTDETKFVWVAETLVTRQRAVKNPKKVEALAKTKKAASRKDKTSRRNTGMIPLLVTAADDRLFARIQNVRGIGRRMDWRGVVLENYIDQLRSKCLEIQHAVEQRLVSDTVFGSKSTPANIQRSADRMRGYADHLLTFHARPFTRALVHASEDLSSAAMIMRESVNNQDRNRLEEAKAILCRIYRSMRILEYHWRLEEVLVLVSEAFHGKRVLEGESLLRCISELKDVNTAFSRSDPFTREALEEGFKRKVLYQPRNFLYLAWLVLIQQNRDPKNRLHTSTAYEYLKQACLPF